MEAKYLKESVFFAIQWLSIVVLLLETPVRFALDWSKVEGSVNGVDIFYFLARYDTKYSNSVLYSNHKFNNIKAYTGIRYPKLVHRKRELLTYANIDNAIFFCALSGMTGRSAVIKITLIMFVHALLSTRLLHLNPLLNCAQQ